MILVDRDARVEDDSLGHAAGDRLLIQVDIDQRNYFGRPMDSGEISRPLGDELPVTKTPVATE